MSVQADRFQTVGSLGRLRSVHSYNSFTRNNRLFLSGAIALAMLACLGLSLYAAWDEAQRSAAGVSPAESGPAFAAVCVGTSWLLGAVLIFGFISEWWKVRKFAAALYDNGLAISDTAGAVWPVNWSEIRSCQVFKYRQGFRQYVLELQTGQQVVLHQNLENLQQLGETVIRQVTQVKNEAR